MEPKIWHMKSKKSHSYKMQLFALHLNFLPRKKGM